jgi:hypothetical protein
MNENIVKENNIEAKTGSINLGYLDMIDLIIRVSYFVEFSLLHINF